MKRSLALALEILVKLGACLTACIGCSPKNRPGAEKPRELRWNGQNSGYKSITAVRPADNPGSTGKK